MVKAFTDSIEKWIKIVAEADGDKEARKDAIDREFLIKI